MPAPEQSSHQPPNPLQGEVVVFTGKLSSLGRKDANALVARLGGTTNEDVNAKTTMLVVGAEGFGAASDSTRTRSQKLIRAEELNAQQPATPIRILSEDQFCRLAGVSSPEAIRRQYYATRDLLARYRSLRDDHMRYLVKCGVIRPVLRTNADTFFAFSDLGVIKQANDDLAQGVSFRSVVRTLTASRAGQLAFDFRIEASNTDTSTLRSLAGQFNYWEVVQRQAYTNKGYIMGDWVGREAKAGNAWLTYHLSADEWVQAEYLYKKTPKDFIPDGTTQHQFTVNVIKNLRPNIQLDAWLQYEHWKAPIYKVGGQNNVVVAGQIKFFPKLHTQTHSK